MAVKARILIDNVLCFEDTEVFIEPGTTLITGPNSAGKSCFAMILGGLLARDPNPLGLSATATKAYVRDGQIEGRATLVLATDPQEVKWQPPAGITAAPGSQPTSSPHAVGLVDFTHGTRSRKDRAQLWEGLFLPSDAKAVLEPVWSRPEAQLLRILETIESQGWEAAQKYYEAQRAEAKRRWQHITGAPRYGPKAATSWVPENWTTELETASEAELNTNLQNMKDELNLLTVAEAVEQSKIDEAIRARDEVMPALTGRINGWKKEVSEWETEETKRQTELVELRQAIEEYRREIIAHEKTLEAKPDAHCPHCKGALVFEGASVAKWAGPTELEINKANEALAAATKSKEDKEVQVIGVTENLVEIRGSLKVARDNLAMARADYAAAEKKAALANATAADPSANGDRVILENAIENGRKALEAFKQYHDALREHENVVELEHVCYILGPDGARAALMKQRMDDIRANLKEFHGITGWREIRLHDDYSISSNGRPIRLCAANEQLKAQWLMQLACAVQTGSKFCILDCADTLTGESWEGLVKLAASFEKAGDFYLVVCGTDVEQPGWRAIRLEG